MFLLIVVISLLLPGIARGETPDTFRLTATDKNFGEYFPTYLANGHFSTQSTPRGTDPATAYVAGLMDYTAADVSRPAAIPAWTEIDYYDGSSWLNQSALSPEVLRDYRQTLDMQAGILQTQYTWVAQGRSTRIDVTTFVSQTRAHEAVTRLEVTPLFDGPVRLRFTLRPQSEFNKRLPLATTSLHDLKQTVAQLYHLPAPSETALLSQMLKPPTPTSANRAAIWYPGAVQIQGAGTSEEKATLWINGRAANGADFAEAAAVGVPENLANAHVAAVNPKPTPGATTEPTAVADEAAGATSTPTLEVTGTVRKGQTYAFTKFVAVSQAGWGGPVQQDVALASQTRAVGFEAVVAEHRSAWLQLWKTDIVVEDPQVQRSVHSDLFYLLENSSSDAQVLPMTACGFSPHYLHHVFWDNDSWDFPALLLTHPERARPLIDFRSASLAPALARAKRLGFQGAMYPWESDPGNGTDQTPHFAHENADREIHINSDVAIAQWQYYLATGDLKWLRVKGYPVIREVARFWVSRVSQPAGSDRYEILHVTSPDEKYSDVNNDSFTNAAAQRALRIAVLAARATGSAADPAWTRIADHLLIPFSDSEQRHLDFDTSVPHDKQTWMGSAVPFVAYPQVDLDMDPKIRRNDFDFAVRSLHDLSPDSNAMLLSMLSIEAAEVGDAQAVGKWLQRQQDGFLKPPFNVRSETALNNTTYILATSSGFLQNFLYGLPGLRIKEEGLVEKYQPILPEGWHRLVLRNLTYRGKQFDLVVERDAAGKIHSARTEARKVSVAPALAPAAASAIAPTSVSPSITAPPSGAAARTSAAASVIAPPSVSPSVTAPPSGAAPVSMSP